MSAAESSNDCAACLEATTQPLLECGHAFHPRCIDAWTRAFQEICPVCAKSSESQLDTGLVYAPRVRADVQLTAQTLLEPENPDMFVIDPVTLLPAAFEDISTPLKAQRALRSCRSKLDRVAHRSDGYLPLFDMPALGLFRVYLGWSKAKWIAKIKQRSDDLPSNSAASLDTQVLRVFGLTLDYMFSCGYTLAGLFSLWPGLSFEDLLTWGLTLELLSTQSSPQSEITLLIHRQMADFTFFGFPDFDLSASTMLHEFVTPELLEEAGVGAPMVFAASGQSLQRLRRLYKTRALEPGRFGFSAKLLDALNSAVPAKTQKPSKRVQSETTARPALDLEI